MSSFDESQAASEVHHRLCACRDALVVALARVIEASLLAAPHGEVAQVEEFDELLTVDELKAEIRPPGLPKT